MKIIYQLLLIIIATAFGGHCQLASSSLAGHFGKIRAISISENDSLLASSSNDGTLKIWDIESQEVIRTITHFTGIGESLLLLNSEKLFLGTTLGSIKKITDFNYESKHYSRRHHSSSISAIAYLNDSVIATGSFDESIVLANLAKRSPTYKWDSLPGKIINIKFAPDEGSIYASFLNKKNSETGILKLNMESKEKEILFRSKQLDTRKLLMRDKNSIILRNGKNKLSLLRIEDGTETPIRDFETKSGVYLGPYDMNVTKDILAITTATSGLITFHDIETGEVLKSINVGEKTIILDIKFMNLTNNLFITLSNNKILKYDFEKDQLRDFSKSLGEALSFQFSRDGTQIFANSYHGKLDYINSNYGEIVKSNTYNYLTMGTYVDDKNNLIAQSSDSIKVFLGSDWFSLPDESPKEHRPYHLKSNNSASHLAASFINYSATHPVCFQLWDLRTKEKIYELSTCRPFEVSIRAFAFHPIKPEVILQHQNREFIRYDYEKKQEIERYFLSVPLCFTGLEYTPDGNELIAIIDNKIPSIINVAKGSKIAYPQINGYFTDKNYMPFRTKNGNYNVFNYANTVFFRRLND